MRHRVNMWIPLLLMISGFPICGCRSPMSASTRPTEIDRLANNIQSLPPWTSRKAFQPPDWEKYIQTARDIQRMPSAQVVEAFRKFMSSNEQSDESNPDFSSLYSSRVLILLRVAYEYSMQAKNEGWDEVVARSWLGKSSNGQYENQSPGWPVSYADGKFDLVADYYGYTGFSYDPIGEYRYVSTHFLKRRLK